MDIAFIVQNLAHLTDSIGYDCLFEYRVLKNFYGSKANIRIFSVEFDTSIHKDIPIEPFQDFYGFIKKHPDATVIYHFCDGWDGVDDFLINNVRNCIVRWHNNTTPWFYALDAIDFARGCVRGFQIMNKFARAESVQFMVNSEFSKRQLEALDGNPSHIHTVFPASQFLEKGKTRAPKRTVPDTNDAPIQILFVGRVVPHKGHRHILSVAGLTQSFLNRPIEVVFVGSVEERLKNYTDELKDIAQRNGIAARFTGAVSDADLRAIYRKATIFMCLSEHEGFGMPVFEAMRSQLPVVAWASSAFSDLLLDHPFAPATFDAYRFAACTIAALRPDVRTEILGIQQKILETYTSDIVSAQLLNALGETVTSITDPIIPSASAALEECVATIEAAMRADKELHVELFDHDSSINYMSLHDIKVYNRLLQFIDDSQKVSSDELSKEAEYDLNELHPHHQAIKHVMAGGRGSDLPPIRHAEELLKFDDETFLRLAYNAVLGREVDKSGLNTYLRRLRRGYDKVKILNELRASEEGKRQGFEIEGLEEAGTTSGGLIAKALELFGHPAPRIESDERRVQRIEDRVRRLQHYLVPPPINLSSVHPAGSIHHVDDLLRLNNRAFVAMAYQTLLGRSVDDGGLDYYVNALRHGANRLDVLASLAGSDEGKQHNHQLEGLSERLAAHAEGAPLAAPDSGALSQRIMRLDNELGTLVGQLIARGGTADRGAAIRTTPVEQLLKLLPAGTSDATAEFVTAKSAAAPAANKAAATKVMKIHQIFINQSGIIPDEMPFAVRENIASIKAQHPKASYKLWGTWELRTFIKAHFERDVLDAFDALKAYALKADLARYCLLYIEGGLYSDLSNHFLNPLDLPRGKTLACFRDHKPLHGAAWMAQNTIIYAEPKEPEIKLAIDLVVANVQNRDYGVSSLAPSGPVLFGRVFAALGRCDAYHIGEAINLQVEGALNRSCYVGPDGTLVAVRLQGGGGKPSQLGLKDTNVYGEMWDRREIYGEGQIYLPYDHAQLRAEVPLTEAGASVTLGNKGSVIASDPLELPRGHYVATFRFAPASISGSASIAITGEKARRIASMQKAVTDPTGRLALPFELTEKMAIVASLDIDGRFAGDFLDLTLAKDAAAARNSASPRTTLEEPVMDEATSQSIHFVHQLLYASKKSAHAKEVEANQHAVKQMHPTASYKLWTPTLLRSFIGDNFPKQVIQAYDALLPSSFKADLARYCLLAKTGGLVIDADIRFVNPMAVAYDKGIAVFRSARASGGILWGLDLGILYANAGQAEIAEAIEAVVEHVAHGYRGSAPFSPTGGELLGRTLAASYRAHHYLSGEVVALTDSFTVRNDCFLSQNGTLLAVRMAAQSASQAIRDAENNAATQWLDNNIYQTEKAKPAA